MSAAIYGKSWHNPRRMLKTGLHQGAHCEGWNNETQLPKRGNVLWALLTVEGKKRCMHNEILESLPRPAYCVQFFQPPMETIGSMHFLNLKGIRKSPKAKAMRDNCMQVWWPQVHAELRRREREFGIPITMPDTPDPDDRFYELDFNVTAKSKQLGYKPT